MKINEIHCVQIYNKNFGENYKPRDIREVDSFEIPEFDVLCAGFPCQSFSIAGKRMGFEDTRGTMFFEIARIAKDRKPKYLFLENVKGLFSHNKGRTFATILATLDELGYNVEWECLNSKNFGVPQNRERVFIIGHRRDIKSNQVFPLGEVKNESNNERVFVLPQSFSKDISILLSKKTKRESVFREQMQRLFKRIQQSLQKKESYEIERESEETRQKSKRLLQEVETIDSWTRSEDRTERICGVVQIPTEEVLLLWTRRGDASISFRQIQQQNLSFECGQERFIKRLRKGKHGSMLFAMQSYQGRLFFSIGDGKNWQRICSFALEGLKSLSYILEDNVPGKYFLSEEQQKKLKDIQLKCQNRK